MRGRRAFLKSAMGALLAAPAAGAAANAMAAGTMTMGAMTMDAGPAGAGFLATRHGAYFLVDGWVLTAADLARLGIREPERPIGHPITGAYAG